MPVHRYLRINLPPKSMLVFMISDVWIILIDPKGFGSFNNLSFSIYIWLVGIGGVG